MPRFSQIVLALAALLAVVFVGWQLLSGRVEPPPPTIGDEAAQSDYYVSGARLLQTDDQGQPEYQATSARMVHRPDQDTWLLQSPTMQIFTETGEPWYGRAERGRIWAGGEEAELQGEVRLWREASAENQPVAIDSSNVYLRPQQKYAETAAPVVLRQEQNRLVGVGARVYLDEERYELLSEVRGRYVPSAN
ncbi:MAG TPA: LPS export ABC transporter periplasmic protein LptC [Gammaproteobacteria bacterium]|nr:LPS export ABC transporter periplasmic protein LptC [Gammaproteobacteria bacterium]